MAEIKVARCVKYFEVTEVVPRKFLGIPVGKKVETRETCLYAIVRYTGSPVEVSFDEKSDMGSAKVNFQHSSRGISRILSVEIFSGPTT